MKTATKTNFPTTVAARIAGEDIQQGDFVTVLTEIVELPSFLWCCPSSPLPADEPVRNCYKPRDAGQPFRVVTVCLPFVYVRRPHGKMTVFDTRRHQLVRLDRETGRRVWKEMRKPLKKKKE